MSVTELHNAIGTTVPISSLYRTLSVFENAGVVAPHFSKKGVTRYELAEWLQGHHHHLICVDCGAIDDVDLPQDYEEKVRELVDGISSIVSFAPMNHALEIEGHCSRCA
jgi:Fur family ferric uptake transcriptional regulator